MQIQELKLLNFRNYDKVRLSFHPHLNIIYGKNGSGKTNLVEAIYVLAFTKSFKQINDKSLIRNNTYLTKIEGVINNSYKNSYSIIINSDGKKVKINRNKINKISDYISKINIVLFNPNDLKMIKDTPSIRRKYLNISISQINVDYLRKVTVYNKLIKKRNAYLKQMYLNGNSLQVYLDILTEKIIDIGMDLYKIRKDYLNLMNEKIGRIYKQITNIDNLTIKYSSDFENKTKEELIKIYKENLSKDITFGKTNFGIHHDDYTFSIDKMDLKEYGSEGQQKNVVISWKFSEIEIIKEEKQVIPILILDDLLSELDIEKINNIFRFINKDIQTFITTTEIDKVSDLLIDGDYKKICVESGKLEEE